MNEKLQKYLAVLYYKLDLNPRIIGDNVVYESKPETLFKDAYEGAWAYDPYSLQEDFFFSHTLDQQGSTEFLEALKEDYVDRPFEVVPAPPVSAFDNIEAVKLKCEDQYLELTYNS